MFELIQFLMLYQGFVIVVNQLLSNPQLHIEPFSRHLSYLQSSTVFFFD